MRCKFLLILLTLILIPNIYAQKPKLMSKDKVVYYTYGQDNTRISSIQNIDTFDVKLYKVADSVYSYQSEGYLSMRLEVNRTNKTAKYEDGNYDENAYDKASLEVIRNSYVVKFVDNRIFEENDIKYSVYRILVFNKKYENSAILLYWCKEFGIIMRKDLSTGDLTRFEIANNLAKNIMIQHLCFSVFSIMNFYNLNNWVNLLTD